MPDPSAFEAPAVHPHPDHLQRPPRPRQGARLAGRRVSASLCLLGQSLQPGTDQTCVRILRELGLARFSRRELRATVNLSGRVIVQRPSGPGMQGALVLPVRVAKRSRTPVAAGRAAAGQLGAAVDGEGRRALGRAGDGEAHRVRAVTRRSRPAGVVDGRGGARRRRLPSGGSRLSSIGSPGMGYHSSSENEGAVSPARISPWKIRSAPRAKPSTTSAACNQCGQHLRRRRQNDCPACGGVVEKRRRRRVCSARAPARRDSGRVVLRERRRQAGSRAPHGGHHPERARDWSWSKRSPRPAGSAEDRAGDLSLRVRLAPARCAPR